MKDRGGQQPNREQHQLHHGQRAGGQEKFALQFPLCAGSFWPRDGRPGQGGRDEQQLFAMRTFDFPVAIFLIALKGATAMRTGNFNLGHDGAAVGRRRGDWMWLIPSWLRRDTF